MSDMVCCPLSSDDNNSAKAYWERLVTARKEHDCCECGDGAIKPGQQYEKISGIWDDGPETYKTCLSCKEIRDHFSCGNGWLFGYLWEDLQQNFFPDMKAGGPCMEGLSPAAKARLFERRLAWALDRGRE